MKNWVLTLTKLTVDKGRYRYFLNNKIADVDEAWTSELQADGQRVVRSVRKVPGLSLSVDAQFDLTGVRAFDVCWSADHSPVIEASYALEDEALVYSRKIGGNTCQSQSIEKSDDKKLLLYPLMRIFTGMVIRQVAEQGGEAAVLVPFIAEPGNTQRLLSPDVTVRRVAAQGNVELQQRDGGAIDCTTWQFIGGQYGPEAQFWLDGSGRLQRYCWQQDESRLWDVRLV